jgi:hypothetical protein
VRFIAGIATILVVPIVAVATVMSLLVVRGVTAPLSGAVFTTTADGEIVNENVHYDGKIDVYLDGGPGPRAPKTAAGLPDGSYYFQVTDPSGVVLLSEDPAKCREIRVQGGVIVQLVSIGRTYGPHNTPCSIQDLPTPPYDPSILDGIPGAGGRHDANVDLDHGPPAIVVQLMPFFNTPNGGGVYKVWVIPTSAYRENGGDANAVPAALEEKGSRIGYARDPGFGPPRDQVKTDNFKISAEAVESPTATLTPVPTRTKTPSQTATTTSVPATPTSTCTSIPPTSTSTAAPPTATPTNTPIPPTLTPTDTVAPPTATSTNTPMPPTATQTPSPSPTVTPTASSTPVPPTATFTSAPPTATRTATVTVATKTPLATHTRRPRHSATPVSRTATSVPAQPTATRTPFSQVATAAVTPVRTPTPRPTGLPIAGSGRADGILWAAIGSVFVLLLIGGGLVAGVRYSHQKPK